MAGTRSIGGVGKILVVLLLVLGSTACSLKFAYNNVDRLLRWQVGDYLDLDAQQKEFLSTALADLMAWHRTSELPAYAQYMYGLSNTLSDGVTEQQIQSIFEQFMVWGEVIEERGMPIAIELLISLSDEQVAALPARLEKSNVEFTEEELDVALEDIQADWAQEYEDVLERFTGRLIREQRAYLARRAASYQPERVLWAEYRRRWQADLLKLLEKRKNAEEFATGFRQLVDAQESYYGEVFTRVSEDNIRLSREVAAHILSNLTEKQNERFVDSLTELARDFEELATQA